MKVSIQNTIIGVLILFILYQVVFNKPDDPIIDPITITKPESNGTSGIVKLEDSIIVDTFLIKEIKYVVDKKYKKLYEEAKDSLEKRNLYLDAISIRKYKDTIVDNSDITIIGEATTRGSLIDYSVDYKIKESSFIYTPEVIIVNPRLSIEVGLDVGIPTIDGNNIIIKPEIGLVRKDGWGINYGYDVINGQHFLGIKKSFKLIE